MEVHALFQIGNLHDVQEGIELPPLGVCQLARPFASEVRTLPAHCVPSAIFTEPATSSFAHGEDVPMPTFPEVSFRKRRADGVPKL